MIPDQLEPSDSGDDTIVKPIAKNALGSLTAEVSSTRALAAPIVQVQFATVARSATLSSATFGNTAETIVAAGLITTIGLPVEAKPSVSVDHDVQINTLAVALAAFSKTLSNNMMDLSTLAVPITSLSDFNSDQTNLAGVRGQAINEAFIPVLVPPMSPNFLSIPIQPVIDVLFQPPTSEPFLVETIVSNDTLTVIDRAYADVQVINLVAPLATVASFINTGNGTLTVVAIESRFNSLNLSGNVVFTAKDNQASSGINVSAQEATGNITLFLHGNTSNQNSTDFINLGNGNDFVLDTGTGTVLINLGGGENTVMLVGVGVKGTINFGAHNNDTANFVTLASNGVARPDVLADNNFVTIGGLNNNANSSDALAFMGDMSSQLFWANGSASAARVNSVSGDPTHLASWISAAQNQASLAHSIAWFQFGGDTYVLETPAGSAGNHTGDTLVKLSGLTEFTGADSQLSIGMLHFVG